MQRPSVIPEWDTTKVNIVEPDSTHKAQGWLAPGGIPEKPPFQTFNHWQNNVYEWINVFSEINSTRYYSTEYSNLTAAIADIGSTVCELWVVDNQTLSASLVVPANVCLKILRGNLITLGSYNLTINGDFYSEPYRVFVESGSGYVSGLNHSYPEWWLDNTTPGTTDMTDAVQAAIDALDNGGIVHFLPTQHAFSRITLPPIAIKIQGHLNAYNVGSARSVYHIINLEDTESSLFYATSVKKVMHHFHGINASMEDEAVSFYENHENASGSSQVRMFDVTIDNCGNHGIVLKDGGNASVIENSLIIGISTASVQDGTGIVSGSIGIDVQTADVKILNIELKGKFDIGVKTSSTHCIIANSFIDQNNTNVLDRGAGTKIIGNRIQYGYEHGMQLGDAAAPSKIACISGNEFSNNNSDKTLATGSYDGHGIYIYNGDVCNIVGNVFSGMDYGIVIIDSDTCNIVGNSDYDIDAEMFDYSSNTGANFTILQDRSEYSRLAGTSIDSAFSVRPGYTFFTGGIAASKPISSGIVHNFDFSATTSKSVIDDGTFLKVNCTVAAQTLTLNDTGEYQMRGCIVIVVNDGAQSFTLANNDGGIIGTTAIASGGKYKYFIDSNGDMTEY